MPEWGKDTVPVVQSNPPEGGKKIVNIYVTADGKVHVEYEE